MIKNLRKLFGDDQPDRDEEADKKHIELSLAVLLIEIGRADYKRHVHEEAEIRAALQRHYGLSDAETADLIARAEAAAEHSVSLHEYTRALHEELDYSEKQEIIEMLWRVALADHSLDKYEDYLLGKIAELLYVSRGDVIRIKHRVLEAVSADDDRNQSA